MLPISPSMHLKTVSVSDLSLVLFFSSELNNISLTNASFANYWCHFVLVIYLQGKHTLPTCLAIFASRIWVSGIYRVPRACSKSYTGQTGHSFEVRCINVFYILVIERNLLLPSWMGNGKPFNLIKCPCFFNQTSGENI